MSDEFPVRSHPYRRGMGTGRYWSRFVVAKRHGHKVKGGDGFGFFHQVHVFRSAGVPARNKRRDGIRRREGLRSGGGPLPCLGEQRGTAADRPGQARGRGHPGVGSEPGQSGGGQEPGTQGGGGTGNRAGAVETLFPDGPPSGLGGRNRGRTRTTGVLGPDRGPESAGARPETGPHGPGRRKGKGRSGAPPGGGRGDAQCNGLTLRAAGGFFAGRRGYHGERSRQAHGTQAVRAPPSVRPEPGGEEGSGNEKGKRRQPLPLRQEEHRAERGSGFLQADGHGEVVVDLRQGYLSPTGRKSPADPGSLPPGAGGLPLRHRRAKEVPRSERRIPVGPPRMEHHQGETVGGGGRGGSMTGSPRIECDGGNR